MRHEPDVAVLAFECLDRGLVIEEGGNDLTVLRIRLLADDNPVAIANGCIDHRIADHLQHEQIAFANQISGESHAPLRMLLGQDRTAGGNSPEQRDVDRVGVADVGVRCISDDQRTGPMWVLSQVAEAFQSAQLVCDGRRRGKADTLADLPHARRVAAFLHGLSDHAQDRLLAWGEPGFIWQPIWQWRDGHGWSSHCGLTLDGTQRHAVIQTCVRTCRTGVLQIAHVFVRTRVRTPSPSKGHVMRTQTAAPSPQVIAPIRLTARGRMLVATVLAGSAIGFMGALGQFSADASDAAATTVAVVQAGESLWTIAQRAQPEADPRATIGRIKELNGLSESMVHVGQALVVPVR